MVKQKEKHKLKCECGKEIIGFSEHHVEQNLRLHKLTSQEHKERIKLIKEIKAQSN